MTANISSAAQARQDAARNANGKFGHQIHVEAPVTLTGDMGMLASRLGTYADEKSDVAHEARRAANDARVAVAARRLQEDHPEIAIVFTSPKDTMKGASVIAVMDADGKELGLDAQAAAQDALRQAQVEYDTRFYYGGIDVKHKSQWIPDDFNPDLDREDESEKGARRALVAMNAAKLDAIEPETRVADMLADMRHYAAKHGVDFDEAVTRSEGYFNEEDTNS